MARPIKKIILGDDAGNNQIGTEDGEAIFGLGGNDTISAWGGNDQAFGGLGNDVVNGGPGNDWLFGEAGDDTLVGEGGNDHLVGGDGSDLLLGGGGNDDLDGGLGSDKLVILRGDGIDTIKNFTSEDKIDLGAFHFASAQAVIDAFKQVGPNAVLDLGTGNRLILQDRQVTDLTVNQFNVSPYLVPTDTNPATSEIDSNISFVSLMTVGDHVGDYTMAGIPDGLGAFDNGDGTFTVLMNHELSPTEGAVHDHGATGAFVSKLVIDKATLEVKSGSDLIQHVLLYNPATGNYYDPVTDGDPSTAPFAFDRLCSADLPAELALYNSATGLGYNGGRIFLNGEEDGPPFSTHYGLAFAHFASGELAGQSYELPGLGKLAHENVVASPYTGDRTVVATMDDGSVGLNNQVYFYVGEKQATGSALEMAGLTGGHLFGLKIAEMVDETTGANPLGADNAASFSLVDLGDVSDKTGAGLDADSEAAGVTSFLRPEDGAWDTTNHNRFYFVTTDAFNQPTRLWAADFVDAAHPELGGEIKLLLDGTENGQQMFDNITVNRDGKLILCEDVGNQAHIGKVWEYDPTTDTLSQIAQHDPSRFAPGGNFFLTQDEESSGVIDVTDILGSATQNAYLIDVQAHFNLGGELVQGGQLLVMYQDLLV